jgi:hypothetical protein
MVLIKLEIYYYFLQQSWQSSLALALGSVQFKKSISDKNT